MKINENLEFMEVVKSNDIIQGISRRKYELTLSEQKILCYIISCLDRRQEIKEDMEIPVIIDRMDFCRLMGIRKSGKNYEQIKECLQKLASNGFWLKDKGEFYFQWITTPRLTEDGHIKVKIPSETLPYLLELKERFTKYKLYQVLVFKSSYSIALYELFKSYSFKKNFEILVEDIKIYLGLKEDSYQRYRNFKQRIIDTSLKEINELSDIQVSLENIKMGREIIGYSVTVEPKDKWDGLESYLKTMQKLNKNRRKEDVNRIDE